MLNSPPPKKKPSLATDPQQVMRLHLTALAKEVACELGKLEEILVRRGISRSQYDDTIVKNPFYKRVLEAEIEEWNSPQNAPRRLQLQAQWMLENTLPAYHVRVNDPNEALPAVNDAIKTLMKMSGVGERGDNQQPGQKFMININIGDGKPIHHEVTSAIEAAPLTIEGTKNEP